MHPETEKLIDPEIEAQEQHVADYAASLRLLADWYEAHPTVELPEHSLSVYSVHSKEAARLLREAAPCTKRYQDTLFFIEKQFGTVKLSFVFYRNEVCTRRVVGVRTLPAVFVPAQPEHTLPPVVEEIVEWDCGPILEEAPDAQD
jgi:hypothetical protein